MNISHTKWPEYLYSMFGTGKAVLEIGSRNITGFDHRGGFSGSEYVGFDIHEGENVDVVGDAHRLSEYFLPGAFDLVFSAATFEHLAMPWVVAAEINKVLRTGGMVFIETHFAYGSHSRPWHFFHFTDLGLKALFSPATGFECIEAGMCNPLDAVFSFRADEYLRCKSVSNMFCHSEYLGRKVADVGSIDWHRIQTETVTGPTNYPL